MKTIHSLREEIAIRISSETDSRTQFNTLAVPIYISFFYSHFLSHFDKASKRWTLIVFETYRDHV